jgi:hypothetical protein
MDTSVQLLTFMAGRMHMLPVLEITICRRQCIDFSPRCDRKSCTEVLCCIGKPARWSAD